MFLQGPTTHFLFQLQMATPLVKVEGTGSEMSLGSSFSMGENFWMKYCPKKNEALLLTVRGRGGQQNLGADFNRGGRCSPKTLLLSATE
jgi:hypothetical protein